MAKAMKEEVKVPQVRVKLKDELGAVVKEVILNKLTNKMERQAVKNAAPYITGENQIEMATAIQHELLKLMIHAIDGKALTANEKEMYEELLSHTELKTIGQVIQQMSGKPLTPEIEFI